MNYRASRTTRVSLEQDQTIQAGESITIFGFLIANATPNTAEVDIKDASGAKNLTFVVPANDSKMFDIEFIADGGLVIDKLIGTGSDRVFVTVFHSQGGS